MLTIQEPLFASAHAALTFAFHFSMQQYDRPLMNKVASGAMGSGTTGLSGMDGAGQAGMIRAVLKRLPPLHQAVLIAKFVQRDLPCDCNVACCRGWKLNPEWASAISSITSAAASEALSGCMSNGRLRSGLVQRQFGVEVSLVALAKQCCVDENTASNHHVRIKRWLKGCEARGEKLAVLGLIGAAMADIGSRLRSAGVVGNIGEE